MLAALPNRVDSDRRVLLQPFGPLNAAQVADKTSTLKITALRTYWVGPVVFVKIETNHGATGWGEIKGTDPRVAKVLAESLFSLF